MNKKIIGKWINNLLNTVHQDHLENILVDLYQIDPEITVSHAKYYCIDTNIEYIWKYWWIKLSYLQRGVFRISNIRY